VVPQRHHDPGWNNGTLGTLRGIKGSDFEAVDTTSLMTSRDSGKAKA
jgi:hypothetical protein